MDFIEQRRHALDFVDDDPGSALVTPKLVPEAPRVAQVRMKYAFVEQIDTWCAWELLPRPSALSDATDAKQEEALARRAQRAGMAILRWPLE